MPATAIATPRNIINRDRPWFYVTCSICGRKMLKKTGSIGKYLCADDEGKSRFQYCVNATIKNNTGDLDAIFFDEAMTTMINISCESMITEHDEDDPYETPQKILDAVKDPKIMSLTVKPDHKTAVNSVTDDDGQLTAPTNAEQGPPLQLPAPTVASLATVKPPATPANTFANNLLLLTYKINDSKAGVGNEDRTQKQFLNPSNRLGCTIWIFATIAYTRAHNHFAHLQTAPLLTIYNP